MIKCGLNCSWNMNCRRCITCRFLSRLPAAIALYSRSCQIGLSPLFRIGPPNCRYGPAKRVERMGRMISSLRIKLGASKWLCWCWIDDDGPSATIVLCSLFYRKKPYYLPRYRWTPGFLLACTTLFNQLLFFSISILLFIRHHVIYSIMSVMSYSYMGTKTTMNGLGDN